MSNISIPSSADCDPDSLVMPSSPTEERPTADESAEAHELDEQVRAEQEYYRRTGRHRLLSPLHSRRRAPASFWTDDRDREGGLP